MTYIEFKRDREKGKVTLTIPIVKEPHDYYEDEIRITLNQFYDWFFEKHLHNATGE